MKSLMPTVNYSEACDRLAREILATLDHIVYQLMMAGIAEGTADEVALTLQEIRAYKTIAFSEPISMNALATAMRISLPTATHVVDSMVSKRIVVRTKSAHDRRLVLVRRTEKAKAREQRVVDGQVTLILNAFEPFKPVGWGKIAKALGTIARVLQGAPEYPPGDSRATMTMHGT